MESEKVKEIKGCLVFCKDRLCEVCLRLKKEPNQEEDCRAVLMEQSLTLINELESENERLIKGLEDLPIPFMGCMLENQLLSNISKKKDGEIKALKDRIAELEIELLRYKNLKIEVNKASIKEFAERLKAKMPCEEIFKGIWDKIDETLKEFIDE